MRKTVIMLLMLVQCVIGFADGFEPNTKWPYIYEEFTDGTIYFANQTKSQAKFNIHLWGNVLHYVNTDGKIYESKEKNVARIEIGGDAYLPIEGKLVQIIANKGNNLVVKFVKGNFNALNQGNGAYGATTNSAATKSLSSLDLGGLNCPELGKMLQEKNDGAYIPLMTEYFFYIDGKRINADKKGVEDFIGADRKQELKDFIKANKIKWKNEDSLKLLLDFVTINN